MTRPPDPVKPSVDRTGDDGERWKFHALVGVTIIIVVLHLYASFFPSPLNWGVHHAGFFPIAWRIILGVLMLAVLVKPVQERLLLVLAQAVKRFDGLRRTTIWLLGFAGLIVAMLLFWIARERLSLLGDGFLVVRRLSLIGDLSDIPIIFKHEPLPGYLMWRFYQLLELMHVAVEEKFATQAISILSGVLSLVLFHRLARTITSDRTDRTLLFLFFLTAGGSQLFFGYMENYPLFYFATLLFIWLTIEYLTGSLPLILPMMALGFVFSTHFGAVTLLPVAAFLLIQSVRRKEWGVIPLSIGGTVVIAGSILWLCGYTPDSFVDVFFKSDKHLIPLTTLTTFWQAYTFFSFEHAIDLANLFLLIHPFAIVLGILYVGTVWKRHTEVRTTLIGLVLVAACGLGFVIVVNTDLGMSRDWDLLSTFCVGTVVAAGFIWTKLEDIRFRRAGIMIVWVMFIHTATWISLNADTQRSYARFEILPDGRIWGRSAMTSAYEVLAVHSIELGDRREAVRYYEKFVSLDSLNPRIWGNIGDIYRHFGEEDKELHAYETATRLGGKEADYFVNLGAIYMNQNRLDEAIAATRRALELRPNSAPANSNIGIMLIQKDRSFKEALPYFERAIAFDSSFSGAYFNAGLCYWYLGDVGKMRTYFEHYLTIDPMGPHADRVREFLAKSRELL